MKNLIIGIIQWIKTDWHSNKFRFLIEVVAWAISIGCATVMALTVPNPPLYILYPIWISGHIMYGWAAWTRQSFGMLANYFLLTCIDSIGLLRLYA